MSDTSPTARALLTLEALQTSPGITAERLGERLGVSARAARRYVATLRDAGIPVDAERGPHGGYRVGRGTRPPPLLFTSREVLALVMAVLEGPHTTDLEHPVGSALAKFVRVLPPALRGPADAVRAGSARGGDADDTTPDPELTAELVLACTAGHRLRLRYRRSPERDVTMDVDPWAVVVRRGRWYLLCWSHTSEGRRTLRVDRVADCTALAERCEAPADLDPMAALEEQLAHGWGTRVVVEIQAPAEEIWLARSLGRLEPIDAGRTRLVASTDDPDWYAGQLASLRAPYRILEPAALREASRSLGRRLVDAGQDWEETCVTTPAPGCVFCSIVSGDAEADVVLSTEHVVAFLDQRPVFQGHVLLVPRQHVVTLPELPAERRDDFLAAGQRLCTAVVDALGAQGSFVAINNIVSQSVPHLHLHVVPRTKGDGLRGFFWPRVRYADGERAAVAARLREALRDEGA